MLPDPSPFLPFQPAPEPSRGITIAEVIRLYLHHEGRRLGLRTREERERCLGLFARAHGHRPIAECRRSDLETWLADQGESKQPSTLQGYNRAIQRAFNWAVLDDRIPKNPFKGVSQHGGEPRRAMTDAEYQKLLRSVTPLFRRVLVFQRWTGARPGEMAGLAWEHVDLEAGAIVLRQHKTSRTQRDPKPRVIPLVAPIVKLLAWLRRRSTEGATHVFINAKGRPWDRNSLSLRMQRARKAAGVPEDCKLYGLRHQFGTMGVVNGLDLKTLAELMGHTSTRTTERHYVHLETQTAHLRRAMAKATARPPT